MTAPAIATFTMKRHDRRPVIRLSVTKKSDGTPFDFTGASGVVFLMYDCEGVEKVNSAAVFDGGETTGVLRYDWATGDTDTAGQFSGEFEVDYGAGDKITMPNTGVLTIRILEDLNNA